MYGYKQSGPKGAILDSDGKVLSETYVCCHCGFPFYYSLDPKTRELVNPGKHKKSWCWKCQWETCGRKVCDTHIPFEQKLEVGK